MSVEIPNDRAVAGGNNPPKDVYFDIHVSELFQLLSDTLAGGEVSNDDQETAIDDLMDEFRKASKDSDKARVTENKPFDDGKKLVQAKWKPIIEKADRGVTACKDALTPYRAAKQRAKDAAAAKAREEADALAKAAQDALRQADDLEAKYEAEQQLEAAQKLTAVANKIDRAPTGLRTSWDAEVVDRKALLLHVVARDPELLTEFLAEYARKAVARGVRSLPGTVIKEVKRAA